MSEKCVVTIRMMFDTDQPEQAKAYAEIIEDNLRGRGQPEVFVDTRDVLDVEITGYSFHGGRSFLYREPPTSGEA